MLSNVLFILLGAALASVGFLTAALTERIRNHPARGTAPRTRTKSSQETTVIPVIAPTPRIASSAIAPSTPQRPEPRANIAPSTPQRPEPRANMEGGSDVINALIQAGYPRRTATGATWACEAAERASLESWTVAALRRCAQGVS